MGKALKKIDKATVRASKEQQSMFNLITTSNASLLGKRASLPYQPRDREERIQKMKPESKCRSYGEIGHWFRDRQVCMDNMQAKDEARCDTDKKKVGGFFRPGGK